jgi:REP element-mobilizing transposase RayT
MPEHVHLLMGEPEKGNPSKVLQVLKQKVSRVLRRTKAKPTKQMVFRFDEEEESRRFGKDDSTISMFGVKRS